MRLLSVLTAVALALCGAAAGAFTQSDQRPPGAVVEIQGVVPWKTLEAVEEITVGEDVKPRFNAEIKALDGQKVRLQGFMLPLEQTEKQSHFLLSAYPPHCSFCLPGGPNTMVEVRSTKPVNFTFEPIVLSGRFALMEGDASGLFYRLDGAAVVPR